jgi:hypothetical protein
LANSFYDVIVLGQDLAATVAGAVLAHRGFRVLLAGVSTEERYAIGPYVLPRSPFALAGMESPALRRIVSELNLVQVLRRRTEPNRPAFQLLLPDHRIDVGDELGRELARELPDSAPAFEAFSERLGEVSAAVESILNQDLILPAAGFWDRRDANRVGARLPTSEEDFGAPPRWVTHYEPCSHFPLSLPATTPIQALSASVDLVTFIGAAHTGSMGAAKVYACCFLIAFVPTPVRYVRISHRSRSSFAGASLLQCDLAAATRMKRSRGPSS